MKIIPTVLAKTPASFTTILQSVTKISNHIHLDIMDGKFVPTKSIPLDKWPKLPKNNTYEAHLMVKHPLEYIKPLAKKGVSKFIIHYETIKEDDLQEIKETIKKNNAKLMIAFKPQTRFSEQTLQNLKLPIMFMGVYPGKNRAPFIYNTVRRVARAKSIAPKTFVQVDGGANINTAKLIAQAGASAYASGSFVSLSAHPQIAMQQLKEASR